MSVISFIVIIPEGVFNRHYPVQYRALVGLVDGYAGVLLRLVLHESKVLADTNVCNLAVGLKMPLDVDDFGADGVKVDNKERPGGLCICPCRPVAVLGHRLLLP